ncbi:MAG: twin-arginine translocase TatA/TatE family subunit [Micavibrio aeruginosavorus]|uniref:Sec-independent protein translocase protein TatA n=1 Tax=Micavibrio aeruginosavorus TaxID=349221 RepID=A0A2W5PNU6_9BACT|nr:MAG: twin-arginine translocase TatA/TatE family subunit [Micavibrio aeruginosavorus]
MGISIWHILVVVIVVFLLFGKGRVSGMMEDLAKGIKSFKKGMADDDDTPPKRIEDKQKDR